MNIRECWDNYDLLTGKASDIARHLAFAGIAIIWVFKTETEGLARVPQELLLPGTLIVVGLALDLLQYFLASSIWFFFTRCQEKKGFDKKEEFTAPPQLNWPAHCLWVAKIVLIGLAYVFLFTFLVARIV